MLRPKESKIVISKILEMIYWLYLKDLKNGNLKDGICSVNKQYFRKSEKKAKTFKQTAFVFKE